MPRQCSICQSPHVREVDRRLKAGTPHTDLVLYLASVGFEVSRHSVDRHARHTATAPIRPRGPRVISDDFLTAVVEDAHEGLRTGELRSTIRDAVNAQGKLDDRSARNADRDLMAKIALALTGQSRPMVTGRVLEPWEVELEREQAPYRKLLQTGDQERDAFAEEDARRLHELQR